MDAVSIRRMHTRYRLPAGAASVADRLSAAQSELLGGALELALDRAGVSSDEEICVRRLGVRMRLGDIRSPPLLASDWAEAIAAGLVGALGRGGEGAIRYRSRMAAWMDCAGGVVRGDLRRAWAWRQLGLWRGGTDLAPDDAAAELVRGMLFEPQVVVSVLAGLAGRGALIPLARRLDSPTWVLLAAAALDAHGASRALLESVGAAPPPRPEVEEPRRGGDPRPERSLRDVPVGGPADGSALRDLVQVLDTENAWPIALLILLAADPALGRRGLPEAQGQVANLVRSLVPLGQDAEGGRDPGGPLAETGPSGPGPRSDLPQAASRAGGPWAKATPGRPSPEAKAAPLRLQDGLSTVQTDSTCPADPTESIQPSPAGPEVVAELGLEPSPSPRLSGRTDWGGLVLLLNLLEPAGVLGPDGLPSPGRTLRWALHRLAQTLAPVSAGDPGALAFAGLGPDARPPSLEGPEASAAERRLIARLRGQLVDCLHRALDAGDEHPEAVLERICRRPAKIVADPGWIEVRFPLAALSTEVRRAGLDLDPNWLPWLGAVVRLRYE